MTGSTVEVERLEHTYPPARRGGAVVTALRGVSFSVEKGELFGVLGPNGGGKTTLFRILSTALRPTGGIARVAGVDVTADPQQAREQMGVVFQSPSLDKKLTVLENISHQGRLYGLGGSSLRQRAQDLLGRVGLTDRADDIVETLSGGLQRRAEIAKGLLHNPSVLLLDEPTTGLDPGARRDVWTYLAELSAQGVTILVTTHLMEEAQRCARLALLDRGTLAALGSPSDLKSAIRGDVVTIETDSPLDLVDGILQKFALVATVQEGTIRLEHPEGHRFVPQLVESFPGLVTAVHVGKPTLEDVFVRYTGHRFWTEAGAAR